MALARWEKPAQDTAGNLLENVWCEVRRHVSGTPLATLYEDREGATPLVNPFLAADGIPAFHAIGGAYRVRLYKAGFEKVYTYQALGTGAEVDAAAILTPGYVMEWEAGTTAPPGMGCIRANNAALGSATRLFISKVSLAGSDIESRLAALVGTRVLLTATADSSQASFAVSALTDHTGYVELTVSGHSGATTFPASEMTLQREAADGASAASAVTFSPTGNVAATDVQAAIAELDNEKLPTSYLDTDGTLAANSDAKVASQKATKTYADTKLALAGGTLTGALAIIAGLVGTPGLAFAGDLDTGIYSPGADSLAIATGGVQRIQAGSDGKVLIPTNRLIIGAADATNFAAIGTVGGLIVKGPTPVSAALVNTQAPLAFGRGATIGLYQDDGATAVFADCRLGGFFFGGISGAAGTNRNAAFVFGFADGAWTDTVSYPTRLSFHTCPAGATAAVENLRVSATGDISHRNNAQVVIDANSHHQHRSYTVSTLPSAATAGQEIYVSNESGGAVLAFSDGTNWRRVTDRAIVS